jgi:hypothetical protein
MPRLRYSSKNSPFQGYPNGPFQGHTFLLKRCFLLTTHDFFSMFYLEQNVCTILQIEFMTSTNLSLVRSRFTESLFKSLVHIMISL